jgi:hypothetical protein
MCCLLRTAFAHAAGCRHLQRGPGREEKPTRRENGHAKRHWGRVCQYTRRLLIRKPAKLTGGNQERAMHMYMGGAHQNPVWVLA